MAKLRAGPCSKPWSTGRITSLPLPPRRPWPSRRARLVSVPGLSVAYHDRISLTRLVVTTFSSVNSGAYSTPAAPSPATPSSAKSDARSTQDKAHVHMIETRCTDSTDESKKPAREPAFWLPNLPHSAGDFPDVRGPVGAILEILALRLQLCRQVITEGCEVTFDSLCLGERPFLSDVHDPVILLLAEV